MAVAAESAPVYRYEIDVEEARQLVEETKAKEKKQLGKIGAEVYSSTRLYGAYVDPITREPKEYDKLYSPYDIWYDDFWGWMIGNPISTIVLGFVIGCYDNQSAEAVYNRIIAEVNANAAARAKLGEMALRDYIQQLNEQQRALEQRNDQSQGSDASVLAATLAAYCSALEKNMKKEIERLQKLLSSFGGNTSNPSSGGVPPKEV